MNNSGRRPRILGIVEKSPGAWGRWGKVKNHDWYIQVRAARRFRFEDTVYPWCISAMQLKGLEPAVCYYQEAATKCGFHLTIKQEGYETVGQLLAYQRLAQETEADLTLIVTRRHMRRVKWICKWKSIQADFFEVDGIPCFVERFTDPILAIAYPIMHKMRCLEKFLEWTIERRKAGKL